MPVVGFFLFPLLGLFGSQGGNVSFPAWEYLMRGVKAGLLRDKGRVMMNKGHLSPNLTSKI